jgi:hypothetical protein
MSIRLSEYIKQTDLYIFIGLLAYMPLHIFLSTWLGSTFGAIEAAKVAKDGVLVVGFLLTLAVSLRQPWFKPLLRDKLLWLIVAYAALTLLLAAIKPTDRDAEVLGVVYNTRFLLFFLYGILLTHLYPVPRLKTLALKAVIGSGILVVSFGIVQYVFLPNDALIHVGYTRDNGVLPAFFIDEKPDLERIMSTVRDPNSFGSYLIVLTSIVMTIMLATRRLITRRAMLITYVLAVICIWLTFSRSALVGFLLAIATFVLLHGGAVRSVAHNYRKVLIASSVATLFVIAGGLFATRNTYLVQNVILHADQNTVLEDPNQLRIRFMKESVENIADHPGGTGPGTAGLASIHNNVQGTVLNEDYYLQIATEVGIAGVTLFMAILSVVAWRLYRLRKSKLVLALLASFVGLAFTNLLVHIWSNEAVAYTWWGLAGLVLAKQALPKATKRT